MFNRDVRGPAASQSKTPTAQSILRACIWISSNLLASNSGHDLLQHFWRNAVSVSRHSFMSQRAVFCWWINLSTDQCFNRLTCASGRSELLNWRTRRNWSCWWECCRRSLPVDADSERAATTGVSAIWTGKAFYCTTGNAFCCTSSAAAIGHLTTFGQHNFYSFVHPLWTVCCTDSATQHPACQAEYINLRNWQSIWSNHSPSEL